MSFADPANPEDLIKEGSDASFMTDVVEASRRQPVIVDFWAPWCGPCRTLGPALEKAVRAARGAVKMIKIDVDRNPAYAGQLRVQSIPTVYAFVNGQPVDGFQGSIPESQIKAFIDKLTGGSSADTDMAQLLSLGAESLGLQDWGGAAQAYAEVLAMDPENIKAIAGLSRVYLATGDADQARQTLAMAGDSQDPDVLSARAQIRLLEAGAGAAGETATLRAKVAADPADHASRFELARALASTGALKAAVDELLTIVQADREWNDQAARRELLTIFEAAGGGSDIARDGRRRLSSILFA
ncbi:MAG: tetratricopeptide repeat protein [Brevundimonas sp.]|uniref:thioredoxin family protein n=1 Tax=Brevundimonas sp. TaxID=1871086 RepID=UPI0022CA4D79|nr:co-chaperone YbbN [Brevundimonas sp.]MCZ8193521.1 co-chaperone YbbN [Brevundimonas sp.]